MPAGSRRRGPGGNPFSRRARIEDRAAVWGSCRQGSGRGSTLRVAGVAWAHRSGRNVGNRHQYRRVWWCHLRCGAREKGTDRVLGPSAARSGRVLPAIAGRWDLPKWPLLLVRLRGAKRYYGHEEALFFRRTLPLSRRESERVAGIVLFDLLPAVVAGAYEPFKRRFASFRTWVSRRGSGACRMRGCGGYGAWPRPPVPTVWR